MRPSVLALLLLVGCADGQPATQDAPASPSPSPTPEVTFEPSPEDPDQPVPGTCSDETITGEFEATIRATDNAFSPDCLIVLAGQGLEILNRGSNLHNFTIEGTDVDLELKTGQPVRTEAIGGAVEPGTYSFSCSYHRAFGMDGDITITDAG